MRQGNRILLRKEYFMKIYTETSLRDFEFWSGAKYTADHLKPEDLDRIEDELQDLYPEGLDETEVNDLFWFDSDFIAEILGFEDWEALEAAREED